MYDQNPASGRAFDPALKQSDRDYAVFVHVVGMISLLDHMVLGIIGVLVMWRIKAGESPFIDDHGRETLNFLLSILLYQVILILVVVFTLGLGVVVFLPATAILWIVRLIFGIRGAMAAQRGEFFRYPITIRFIG